MVLLLRMACACDVPMRPETLFKEGMSEREKEQREYKVEKRRTVSIFTSKEDCYWKSCSARMHDHAQGVDLVVRLAHQHLKRERGPPGK